MSTNQTRRFGSTEFNTFSGRQEATGNDLFDFRFGKRVETNSNFAPIEYEGQVRKLCFSTFV
jgi:hypothetical protein